METQKIDAVRYLCSFFKSWRKVNRSWTVLLPGIGYVIIVLLILSFKGKGLEWVISVCGALRIFGIIYNLFTARMGTSEKVAEDIIESLNLKGNAELENLIQKLSKEDAQRAPIDKGWIIISFLLILFFIHLGRMGSDQSASGILSPLVAVIGDLVIALIIALGFIAPLRTQHRQFETHF